MHACMRSRSAAQRSSPCAETIPFRSTGPATAGASYFRRVVGRPEYDRRLRDEWYCRPRHGGGDPRWSRRFGIAPQSGGAGRSATRPRHCRNKTPIRFRAILNRCPPNCSSADQLRQDEGRRRSTKPPLVDQGPGSRISAQPRCVTGTSSRASYVALSLIRAQQDDAARECLLDLPPSISPKPRRRSRRPP